MKVAFQAELQQLLQQLAQTTATSVPKRPATSRLSDAAQTLLGTDELWQGLRGRVFGADSKAVSEYIMRSRAKLVPTLASDITSFQISRSKFPHLPRVPQHEHDEVYSTCVEMVSALLNRKETVRELFPSEREMIEAMSVTWSAIGESLTEVGLQSDLSTLTKTDGNQL